VEPRDFTHRKHGIADACAAAMSRQRWVAVSLFVLSCNGISPPPGGADVVDASPDSPIADAPSSGASWESNEILSAANGLLISKVSYRSNGLRVFGRLCRPEGPGPFPVIVNNHGGFDGVRDWTGGLCRDGATNGYAVIESSYRGEDGSDGRVEVCLGEVDDVLEMLRVLLAQSHADPKRVVMLGASHGGCITLRAVERGAPVHGAVALVPATDIAKEYAFCRSGLAGNPTTEERRVWEALIAVLDKASGGPPEAFPDEYARRSPAHFSADLDSAKVPVMIVSATDDFYVPPSQGCDLAAKVGEFAAYHVTADGTVVTTTPSDCNAPLAWLKGPLPRPTWPASRYILVFDGLGHGLDGANKTLVADSFVEFLLAKTPRR
jgi:acetyl esterase/lipase